MSKGRGNASALTIGEVLKFNIDKLRKSKSLVKGQETTFVTNWSNGNSIGARSKYTDAGISIVMEYNYNGKPINYTIRVVEVSSNLGKGVNLYFVCPVSGYLCKTLYLCYGSEMFKSSKAYKNRIYYDSQIYSNKYYRIGKYFDCERKIENFYKCKRLIKTYKGKPTKRAKRLEYLLSKADYYDRLREQSFINTLYGMF